MIDCGAIHDVDLMACEMLVELDRELRARGIRLVFGDLRDRVKNDIVRGLQLGRGRRPDLPELSPRAVASDRGAQLNRTYSKSAGWPLMPRAGGAIQLANLPGSMTAGPISEVT